MEIQYKATKHIDKTESKYNSFYNHTEITTWWDGEEHITPCCPNMDKAIKDEFIEIRTSTTDIIFPDDYPEPKHMRDHPHVCMKCVRSTWDEVDYDYMPIYRCPFCSASVTLEIVEEKEITHKCKKKKVTQEVCEPYAEEKIIMAKDGS